MADSYRPGRGQSYGHGQNQGYGNDYDRNSRYDHSASRYDDRYDDRPPPQSSDRYAPPSRQYQHAPPSYSRTSRDQGGNDYSFRGAAGDQSYRPQDNFTFRASGPAPPSFPPQEQYSRDAKRPRRIDRAERGRDGRFNQRGRGTGPRRFVPKPAHGREILRTSTRATTPEQLAGMNEQGHTRFKGVEDVSSESEDDDVDLTSDASDEENPPRKRAKTNAITEATPPRWSNPDPYTVLPPPETLGAPKKDIVQVIRKAKVEAANSHHATDAAKENVDFISFDLDDGMDESEPDSPVMEEPRGSAATSFNPINGRPDRAIDPLGPPPAPPPGFVMPSDADLIDMYTDTKKGTKRKHERDDDPGDIVEDWHARVGQDATPWRTSGYLAAEAPAIRLHKEICDFYEFVRPHAAEEAIRTQLVGRVQRAVQSFGADGRNVEIRCFGSFAAGLYLPTADMDLVALSPLYLRQGTPSFCQSASKMHKLARHLEHCGLAPERGVLAITRAKVPIVKFTDKLTGIKVDISFENDSGIKANETFQEWKEQYPSMPAIVVLLKQLLAMRDMNEVYNGGVGGFTTICLVVSMMQHLPHLQAQDMDPQADYGNLLMHFLELYGKNFDIRRTGIMMRPARYYDKMEFAPLKQNQERLTIIDPNRPDNDISGGSSRIEDVLNSFSQIHAAIQRRLGAVYRGEQVHSILGCVLGGDYRSFIEQRQKLSSLHYGYAVSSKPSALPQKPSTLPKKPSSLPQKPSTLPQKPSTAPQKPSGREPPQVKQEQNNQLSKSQSKTKKPRTKKSKSKSKGDSNSAPAGNANSGAFLDYDDKET